MPLTPRCMPVAFPRIGGVMSVATTTTLTGEQIANYQRDGIIDIPGVLTSDEVTGYREAAADAYEQLAALDPSNEMFRQIVQVWHSDEVLRELTFHRGLAGLATEL